MKSGYLLSLSLAIDDPAPLWDAAATLAMESPGMTMEDVADTIGPRAAPNIEDCLTLLLQPERFKGCALKSLDIARLKPPLPTNQAAQATAATGRYRPFDRIGTRHPASAATAFEAMQTD